MNFQTVALGLVLAAVSVFAVDVDGQWTGSMSMPNGDAPINCTFKAEGRSDLVCWRVVKLRPVPRQ